MPSVQSAGLGLKKRVRPRDKPERSEAGRVELVHRTDRKTSGGRSCEVQVKLSFTCHLLCVVGQWECAGGRRGSTPCPCPASRATRPHLHPLPGKEQTEKHSMLFHVTLLVLFSLWNRLLSCFCFFCLTNSFSTFTTWCRFPRLNGDFYRPWRSYSSSLSP